MADLMTEYINVIFALEPAYRNRLMAFGTTTINLDIDRNSKEDIFEYIYGDRRVTSMRDRFYMAACAIRFVYDGS